MNTKKNANQYIFILHKSMAVEYCELSVNYLIIVITQVLAEVCAKFGKIINTYIPYSREQKHVLLFRKSEILLFKVSIINMPHILF